MGDSHHRKGSQSAQEVALRKIFIGGLSYNTDDGEFFVFIPFSILS